MSLSADHMRLLLDGGHGAETLLLVAGAMERGDDYRVLADVIEKMRQTRATSEMIADVVALLAQDIAERNAARRTPQPDEHSGKRDSNRSRRGMSDQRWRSLRQRIFERDDYACQYCGCGDDLTCDHIVPLVRGGTNDNENLATACRSCNSSKGEKLLSEWGRYGD